MTTDTSGSQGYLLVLPEPYHFNRAFPLEITHAEEWFVRCAAFKEYGAGDSLEEAIKDLASSILEQYELSKKRQARGHKIGQPLKDLIKLFEESTKEGK